jgi:hypothetical protein
MSTGPSFLIRLLLAVGVRVRRAASGGGVSCPLPAAALNASSWGIA